MITPNKIVPLTSSALGLTYFILECGPDEIELVELFHLVEKKFDSIDQFMVTMDLLFVLGQVNINFQTRTVSYVS